jgi:hypothetical protein
MAVEASMSANADLGQLTSFDQLLQLIIVDSQLIQNLDPT